MTARSLAVSGRKGWFRVRERSVRCRRSPTTTTCRSGASCRSITRGAAGCCTCAISRA
ncbi:hypothetical protein ACFQDE_21720 [Deinococcus caeni]|uniref:hypothetical protein n=1 Tax=Deinococcus caeni TaxID=569127 RepID=UPI0036204ABD